MKKMKLMKAIAGSLTIASMFTIYPVGASAEWKQDSIGWWNTEGSSWSIGWREIDGKWYYFDQDGYMAHDTVIDGYELAHDGAWIQSASANENKSFNINDFKDMLKAEGYNVEERNTLYEEGAVSRGWKLVNGKYYFFTLQGHLAKDEIVDGYYLGSDGALDASKGRAKLYDFTIKPQKDVYPLGTESIKVSISNNTDFECVYGGEFYEIDKFEDNEWHKLAYGKNVVFDEVAFLFPPKQTSMKGCNLTHLKDFEKLTAGRYRMLVEIDNPTGCSHLAAEFELQ